jgi:outer membrane biosynthesis protein TonB
MAEVRDDRQMFMPRGAAGRRSPAVLVMLMLAVVAAIALMWNISRRSAHRAGAPLASTAAETVDDSPSTAEPAATAAAPAESAAAAAEPAPAIDEQATAQDQAQIARVINDGRAGITNCYQRALVRDDKLVQGELRVRVSVAPSGRVGSVNVSGPARFRAMEPCLKRTINKWTFPTAAEPYATEFPLVFRGVE